MTDRLKQAIGKVTEEAQKISDSAQDEIAARLEAIASDMYWKQLLEDIKDYYKRAIDPIA